MRFRAAGIAVAGLALAAVIGWPAVTTWLTRHVEARLSRETGRDWRVGGLAFAGGPSLVLTDVVTGDSENGMRVARMTVSAPRASIADGAGALRLQAEGLALRLPVEPARLGLARTGDAPPHAIRGRGRGPDIALSADGRRVVATLAAAEIEIDPSPDTTAPIVDLAIEEAGHRVALTLDRPGPDATRRARLDIAPAPAERAVPHVRLAANLRAGPDLLALEGIAGTFDGSPVSGSARLALAAKPVLTADLRLDDLALTAEGDDAPRGSAPGPRLAVPTDILPRAAWFAAFDGDLRFAVARLALGSARFEGVTAVSTIRDRTLESVVTVARAYEGEVKLRYALSPAGEGDRHRLSVTLARARIKPLLTDLVGAGGLDARAAARIDLQATGTRPAELPRTATGFADVSLTEGRVDGSGLGAFADGPFARFHTLGGSFSIADGRAVTNDLRMTAPQIQATGIGTLDLVDRTLDLRFQPALAPQRGRPASGRALDVPIQVSGPWHDPAVSADMSGLLQNPAGALEAIRELGTGLLGGPSGPGDGRGPSDGRGSGGFGSLLDAILSGGGREPSAPRRR